MNFFYRATGVSMILLSAFGIFATFSNQDYVSNVESAYSINVIGKDVNWSSPNDDKLIIDKDGQRLRCNVPSSDDVKNKTPLTCDAPATTKVEAK